MNELTKNSGEAQGAIPAKIEKLPKLKFNESQTNQKRREILSQHFVKMSSFGYFFKINVDKTVDWANPISEADMFLNLEDRGLRESFGKVKNLLASEFIKEVTPLHLMSEQILQEEWDGVDRISQFIEALNLEGDASINHLIIRKWILNTYAVAFNGIDTRLNEKAMPRVVMILHSDQRKLGKSSIFRWLGMDGLISKAIPKLGAEIYSELQSGFKKDDKEFPIMLACSLIINFDDVGEFFMKHPAELRAICTQTSVQQRQLFTGKVVSTRRRAGLCGTTNNSTVLRDPDENRYAVFTLNKEGVNWDVIDSLNPLDLWRQAGAEADKAGFGVNWTNVETNAVIEMTKGYLYRNPLEEFIDGHFVFDPEGDMKWIEIKEVITQTGSLYEGDKNIRHAVNRLVPQGEKLVKTLNGYSTYRLSKKLPVYTSMPSDADSDPSDPFIQTPDLSMIW